jgi:DNA-directed RNA polymerase subunit beta
MTLRSVDFVNSGQVPARPPRRQGHVRRHRPPRQPRRLRTIDELAGDELRKGFLKLRRTVQERMAIRDLQDMSPRSLINPKSVERPIEYFFGRSELSQVVDQTNPLAQLTHERRLSALRAGRAEPEAGGVRGAGDVHISHYGRICPIETPEAPTSASSRRSPSTRRSTSTGS